MSREEKLAEFVGWAQQHITGDEKGQAQIFLDRLFQAFGHPGVLDVGGQTEFRIRQAAEDGGGTAFADLVWKPVVLFEMKKRGVDLQRHYRQAFDYWTRLVPNRPRYVVLCGVDRVPVHYGPRLVPYRPRYVVLCNFDQFRVYDFETQMDAPVDTLPIAELPARWGPLAFLFPGDHKPTFNNDRVAVTREAADALATCFKRLVRPDRSLCSPARARHPSPQLVNPLSKLRRRSGRMGLAMPQPRNMLAPMDVSTYNCIKSFLQIGRASCRERV